jgi:hypothetical protein
MRKLIATTAVLVAALGMSAPPTAALAASDPNAKPPQCFESHNWDGGWTASNDAKTMYIKVLMHDVYRVDLVGACPELGYPGARIITVFRGPTQVCSAVDLDMKVSDGGPGAIAAPCLVDRITPMSPAEVKDLPAKLRP